MQETILRFFSLPVIYPIILCISAAASVVFAFFLLTVTQENAERKAALPRAKVPGIILGAIVLFWCIPNVMPILPENLHKFLFPTAILLIILSWFALDHLLARAIAGAMILTAHYFLYHSFAVPAPLHTFFAVLLFIFGTIGIWFSGRPYDIRDLIRKSADKRYRFILPAFLFLFAAMALLTAIFRFAKGPLS